MSALHLTLDVGRASRLRGLRDRLRVLINRGDWDGASRCADLILELVGLRPFRLEHRV
jgi:hypothetical protein